MATCWTSAGDAASDRPDLRSPLTLRERIEAASAAGYRGFGLLSDDLPAAVAEYGLSRNPGDARRQRNRPPRARGHPVLVGRRVRGDRNPIGSGTACSRRRKRSAPGTSRSHPTVTTPHGTAGAGPASSPSSRPRRTMSVHGWGSSSFPGRTSRRCTTACGWSPTPDTKQVASSSTPGTSPARTRRLPISLRAAAPHHRRRTGRRRRGGGRDAVRGYGPPSPVLRRGCIRPARHDHGPAHAPGGTDPGASRSCPTNTDPCLSTMRSAGRRWSARQVLEVGDVRT